jgi:hypothetical protein
MSKSIRVTPSVSMKSTYCSTIASTSVHAASSGVFAGPPKDTITSPPRRRTPAICS